MAELDGLISSLEQNLKQTKQALAILYERRAEFQKRPDAFAEGIEQNKADIFTLEKMVEQTEIAISGLSARTQTSGFGDFDIGSG
ncbi:MAG TPA: hypothetical protein VIL74_20275 [Pyrinomonadaceae bacterium]|jgi:CRISPR/Cas system CMR-associated protein Cmr1 (group 7 of RAMP superfamily)